ncbi:hypothetical protein [Rhodoferax sp.]|uniref:hypothetical protein n=1 Tax=Rhodoferax sp. TaxID=50421 RepID=UPI00260C140A|nr:hypothetical protein [Rhodoferax sp.]
MLTFLLLATPHTMLQTKDCPATALLATVTASGKIAEVEATCSKTYISQTWRPEKDNISCLNIDSKFARKWSNLRQAK